MHDDRRHVPPHGRTHRMAWRWMTCASLCGSGAAAGQSTADPVMLDPVTVSAQRTRESSFDAPAAISVVTRDTIETAGPQVNLSEALRTVPGISILNRQNYAQDLQLSIRGFGARSTFGIRGVRIIVDGIPATMPDGQAQASSIDLNTAGRIEVLRGPLAQLYGNAAGGVVQVFTQDDAAQPTTSLSIVGGSYGLWKVASTFSTSTPGYGLTLGASWFQTDGWREHSAAERGQFNGRWQSDLTPTLHASVVVNSIDQPVSLDPAGLTRAQWQSNPRQTAAVVLLQDARKSVHQTQIGNVEEWRIDDNTSATARLYVGQRDLDNALSTPLSAQLAPTSSGGIVSFARAYFGTGLLVSHRIPLDAGRAVRVVGGLDYDRLYENRQGYIDNAGVQGALKRDERNVVDARGLFAQAAWDFATAWTLTAGVRHSSVRFSSDDRFITATNPDDSGGVNYAATNPVAGMSWRATSTLNVYANVGRGFETPAFTELAYQPNATGLNFGLRASHSRHAELGLKWKLTEQQRLDVALFDVGTRDEIVVDTNDGGRSTYKNAGRTTRRGVEASYVSQLGESVHATLSYTQLQARFRDGFASGDGASTVQVAAGNRLPGVASRNGFAELAWQPKTAWGGFTLAAELIHTGKIYASDANDDAAASATVFNLRSSLAQELDRWKITELLRLDNATDKRYAGSVIVNDANKRYFEPALPRNWLLGITARHEFD